MPKISPSKKVFIGMIAAAVLLFLVCGFTYYNRASRLHVLGVQLKDKEQKLADSEKIVKQLTEIEQDYLDAQAKLGILESGVSTKAYVPTLLRQLEEMGKSVNLRVVGVRPKAPEVIAAASESSSDDKSSSSSSNKKKEEPYDKLNIEIDVNGKYWDVARFLRQITSFPKIIAVNDLQVNPLAQGDIAGSPMLSVKFNTTAFILKETAPVKKPQSEQQQAGVSGERI